MEQRQFPELVDSQGPVPGVASTVHRIGNCRSHLSSDEPRELGERDRTM